jgi:VIT1/CCC1 family predicted Fe2+/Mn2+ transporter
MATGEYISVQSQKELFEYEIEVERKALEASPEEELRELVAIFQKRGVELDVAERLATDLMRSPELALRTHAREELGIDPDSLAKPWVAAYSSFIWFSVGALVPLLPWLFTSRGDPLVLSLVLTAAASASVGGAVGWFTHRGVIFSALRSLAITTLAASVTFAVGHLVGA